MRRIILAGTAMAALMLSALPARADAPPQALTLCTEAPRGCAIRVADSTREGATIPVTVQGRPQTRVHVMAYQAIAEGADLQALEPLGDGVELLTNYSGVANADLGIPAVARHPSSGWVLISVAGVEDTDVSLTVGTFAPFGTRTPTVLGDGYAEAKPVGVQLDLAIVGAIAGTRYAVEIQNADGSWGDITVGDGFVQGPPDEVVTVSYMLPRGLTAAPKKVRLRNVSDSAAETIWIATPSIDGEPSPLAPLFVPPPVGDALDGTATLSGHPVEEVRLVATGIAAGSVAFVVLAIAGDAIRRRGAGGAGDA